MKRALLAAAALGLMLACGDQGTGPVGVGGDGSNLTGPGAKVGSGESFLGVPVARDAVTPQVLGTSIRRLDEGEIGGLIKQGRLTAEDARLEGGACPVLMDCWWTDEREYQQDILWENYCFFVNQPLVGVFIFKVGDMAADPCPIPPTHLVLTVAFTQCKEGKPDPRPLVTPPVSIDFGGPIDFKGLYIGAFFIGGLGPGVYDSFFLMDWDGTGIIPIDDSCGLDLWERPDGRPFPPRILMIFGPEPPHPPGGWPPCRLAGEDGETRPWCVTIQEPPPLGCKTGCWIDNMGFVWNLTEDASGNITGTVNTGPCGIYDVVGFQDAQGNTTLTATEQPPNDPNCCDQFTMTGVATADCNSISGTWTNVCGLWDYFLMSRCPGGEPVPNPITPNPTSR